MGSRLLEGQDDTGYLLGNFEYHICLRVFLYWSVAKLAKKSCFAGCRLLGGQGDGLPGMGVPKLAVAPHKLLTQAHKHGSYRIIKYQTIPDQSAP